MKKQLSLVSVATLSLGLSACVEMDSVDTTALRTTDGAPICAFVIAQVGGQWVTTPAIPVYVPDSGATVDPIKVHVDPTDHSILGYSVPGPGVDYGTDAQNLYIPGVDTEIPSFSATLPELGANFSHCVAGADETVPAIPVHVPASVLEIPGAFVEVPAIGLNILGNEKTVGGFVVEYEGRTLLLPGVDVVTPELRIQTPPATIGVELDATYRTINFMDPAL